MPSLDDGKRKKGSKRIQAAVKRLKRVGMESHELNLSSESDSDEEIKRTSDGTTSGKQAASRIVKGRNKAKIRFLSKEKVQKRKKPEPENPAETEATSTTQTTATSSNITATLDRLTPKKNLEIIPQRVQAESDKMKNKQKAIEVFKKRKVKP